VLVFQHLSFHFARYFPHQPPCWQAIGMNTPPLARSTLGHTALDHLFPRPTTNHAKPGICWSGRSPPPRSAKPTNTVNPAADHPPSELANVPCPPTATRVPSPGKIRSTPLIKPIASWWPNRKSKTIADQRTRNPDATVGPLCEMPTERSKQRLSDQRGSLPTDDDRTFFQFSGSRHETSIGHRDCPNNSPTNSRR